MITFEFDQYAYSTGITARDYDLDGVVVTMLSPIRVPENVPDHSRVWSGFVVLDGNYTESLTKRLAENEDLDRLAKDRGKVGGKYIISVVESRLGEFLIWTKQQLSSIED